MYAAFALGSIIVCLWFTWYHGTGGLEGEQNGWVALEGLDVALTLVAIVGMSVSGYLIALSNRRRSPLVVQRASVGGLVLALVGALLVGLAFIGMVNPPSGFVSDEARGAFQSYYADSGGGEAGLSPSVGPFLALALSGAVIFFGYQVWKLQDRPDKGQL